MVESKKKILVVGGAGYLGGAVTDLLLKSTDQYKFKVYDNLTYEDEYRKPVDFVFGDILDHEKLKRHLDWADVVIWLAAMVGDGASSIDEVLTSQINQESVSWLVKNFNKRIIFTSTCSVYGAQDELLDESSDIKPISLYAFTKTKAEKHLQDSDAVIFRLGTLFGMADVFSRLRLDLVVNLMTARAFSTGKIRVFGGDQYRPLLHVRDAAKAIVKAVELPRATKSQIYNLRTVNVKIVDVAEHVKKHFPNLEIEKTELSFEDARNYKVSRDKAEKVFDFTSDITLDDGIKELKEIFEAHRIKNFDDPHFSNHRFLKDYLTHT